MSTFYKKIATGLKVPDNFEKALKIQEELENDLKAISAKLNTYPKSKMGLTLDEIKKTPEWQYDYRQGNIAFTNLRNYNKVFVKKFAKELREHRKRNPSSTKYQNPSIPADITNHIRNRIRANDLRDAKGKPLRVKTLNSIGNTYAVTVVTSYNTGMDEDTIYKLTNIAKTNGLTYVRGMEIVPERDKQLTGRDQWDFFIPRDLILKWKEKGPTDWAKYRNPSNPSIEENEATALFEEFRGRKPLPEEQYEIDEIEEEPDNLTEIGRLIEIGLLDGSKHEIPISLDGDEDEEVILAADPVTKQLYVIGTVDLEGVLDDLNIPSNVQSKRKIDLGEAVSITYEADKQQFDDDVKDGAYWYHVFGEDLTSSGKRENFNVISKKLERGDSSLPVLVYDKTNKKLELVGGSYHIDSSGIRN